MKRADSNRGDLEYGLPSFERGGSKFGLETNCSYFDILQYAGSNGPVVRTSTGKLDETSLEQWLSTDISKITAGSESLSEDFTGGLRLLLGSCAFDLENGYRIIPFTEEKYNTTANHFQIHPQFIPSMTTTLSRSFKFSCSPSSSSVFKPTTCFIYKVSPFGTGQYHISLSYSPTQNLTYALLLFKSRYELAVDDPYFSIIQNITHNPALATHPLFIPIILADLSISSSSPRIHAADERLNELERAAGQHEWADLVQGDPLNLDFTEATKQLNFTSRWVTMEIWRCKTNLLVLETIKSEIDLLLPGCEGCENKALEVKMKEERKMLKEMTAYHINTCDNLILRAEFEHKRCQTQIAVVYQFMAQKDSKVNLQLAATTTTIAQESKKDSSAMKAIAVLTMCFLPGTFLAAVFAMPLFDWDGGDIPVIKNGFKLYWAIAIPLTLLVLLVWAAGMLVPWRRLAGRISSSSGTKSDVEANAWESKKES